MIKQPKVKMTYTELLEIKRVAFEHGQQYERESCIDDIQGAIGDWGGPEREHYTQAMRRSIEAIEKRKLGREAQESGRESARKLIAKWRTEAKEDRKHGDWDLAKEKERCADELEAAMGASATDSASVTDVGAGPVKPSDASRICSTEREPNVHETGAGASATDSASVRGASNCLKVPLRMGSADVSASTPETGAAAREREGEGEVCRWCGEPKHMHTTYPARADYFQCKTEKAPFAGCTFDVDGRVQAAMQGDGEGQETLAELLEDRAAWKSRALVAEEGLARRIFGGEPAPFGVCPKCGADNKMTDDGPRCYRGCQFQERVQAAREPK